MKNAGFGLLVAILTLASCAAPARRGDPQAHVGPVRETYFRADKLHLRPVAFGDFRVPRAPLERAAHRLSQHTGRPVALDEDAQLLLDLPPGEHDVLGFIHAEMRQRGAIDAGTILVVPVAGERNTGYLAWRGEGEPGDGLTPMVILLREGIINRSGFFVNRDKLWEWTINHEIGHILGVPASREHAWIVPCLGGNHCTHPECVMYTGFDWRVLWTGLVRGWPLDFCEHCSRELREARTRSAAAPSAPQGDSVQ
jgi:hypothetical protein